jgi:hypothetical protein
MYGRSAIKMFSANDGRNPVRKFIIAGDRSDIIEIRKPNPPILERFSATSQQVVYKLAYLSWKMQI